MFLLLRIYPPVPPGATKGRRVLRRPIVRDGSPGCSGQLPRTHLTPEPLKPVVTPLKVSDGRFGTVPRSYIECTRDRTVTLEAQRRMQMALPCEPVITLDSDHSPFLSHPRELAVALSRIVC